MRKLFFFIPIFFALFLSGCGVFTENSKVKQDLSNYVKQSNELSTENAKAFKIYMDQGMYGNDWNKIHDDLKNNVIPKYEQLLQMARNIKMETDQVKTVHGYYIQAIELHLQTLKDSVTAIEEKNQDKIVEVNKKMLTVKDLYAKRDAGLKELINKYDMNITVTPTPIQ